MIPDSSVVRPLFFLVVIIFSSCLATYYYFDKNKHSLNASGQEMGLARDYYHSPLNMSDAYQYCVAEAKRQLGGGLQSYGMDEISSFYNQKKKIFFVVLKVNIGGINNHRSASIYCDVDPKQYKVSHYKEVFPDDGGTILTRTIEFFSKL